MEFLTSNYPPLKLGYKSFSDTFSNLLSKSDYMQIASGYISTESITEIKRIIEANSSPKLDLLIGMHYFDGITRTQYEAALYLDDYLKSNNMGSVSIASTFKFHGKLYSFSSKGETISALLGSSNLNNILDVHRSYEIDILTDDKKHAKEIDEIITSARNKISTPISDWMPKKFIESNPLLEGHEYVEKVLATGISSLKDTLTGLKFEIPLKATSKQSKSNLNVYFGKGRENKSTNFIKPRHWYEVELIVPKSITQHDSYPKAGYPEKESVISVITDDGWKFDCKISGDYSKNFRSNNDLKILGKWIKGRLENSGALKVGELVTEMTLEKYGRNTFALMETKEPGIWLLDFGV